MEGARSSAALPNPDVDVVGVDPYDALRGSRVPAWVGRHRATRQALIQLRKRLPIDLAPLLGVPPFMMAKAVACFLTATARTAGAAGSPSPESHDRARALVSALLGAEGNLGDGAWGYEFDVQTRWAYYPTGTPNVIATAFVAHALLEAGSVFGESEWTAQGIEAASFVSASLLVRDRASSPWIRYTPSSDALVHNASLLGASVLAQAGETADDAGMVRDALEVARTSIARQRADGRWAYGEQAGLEWADNFHTAYNLMALLAVWRATGDEGVAESLRLGAEYWQASFFDSGGVPKYYDTKAAPLDIHCAATAIEAAVRLGEAGIDLLPLARSVAEWTRAHLVAPDGTTYYRRHGSWTDRRHFVRWGDGHWAIALATLEVAERGASGGRA